MNQNAFVATRAALDLWGNVVKEYRCEQCGQWVPITFSCDHCRKMVCQKCYQAHLEATQ